MPFKMLGTSPLWGHALENVWDRPTLGTGPLITCLGQAHSWDMPFKVLGTGPLLGHALYNTWDRPALGSGCNISSTLETIVYLLIAIYVRLFVLPCTFKLLFSYKLCIFEFSFSDGFPFCSGFR